jgi:hypothetical protein
MISQGDAPKKSLLNNETRINYRRSETKLGLTGTKDNSASRATTESSKIFIRPRGPAGHHD